MSVFKCGFDAKSYKDIYPPYPTDNDIMSYSNGQYLLMPDPPLEILNGHIDEIDEQYWIKAEIPDIITPEFIFKEVTRLKKGCWIFIKGELIWIPPNYYQFLQYGNAAGDDIQFRLRELEAVYEKIRVRVDTRYLGTYRIKDRQSGATTIAMNDLLWEAGCGELTNGIGGIQSKTNEDGEVPCWLSLQSQWLGYPSFIKEAIYPHYASGNNYATKMEFVKQIDPTSPSSKSQKVLLRYFPATYNAMDGKTAVKRCILDEINKWEVCSFAETFAVYKKFIQLGKTRKGVFDIFSSPSTKSGRCNDEAYDFWCNADPNKITDLGSTKNRIRRIYSCPLKGIEGFYDKFGDADPDEIYEHIISERKNIAKDKLMAEIRACPLPIKGTFEPNEEELFGATDNGTSVFINSQGIKKQHLILMESNNEVVYGNLNWPDNVPFSGIPIFKQYDTNDFDEIYAKFCFSFTKFVHPNASGDIRKAPPSYLVENVIGFDPINREMGSANKKVKSRLSEPAAVCWRFRDTSGYGIEKEIIGSYLGPVGDQRVSQMDMLKFMLFTNSMLQIEKADGNSMMQCAYDNGMIDWMIDGRTDDFVEVVDKNDNQLRKIKVKGDMPSGRGSSEFIGEIIELINGITAPEYNESATPDFDPASKIKHRGVTGSLTVFDPSNTEKAHFTMALGQALIGAGKLMYGKKKMKSGLNNEMLRGLLD